MLITIFPFEAENASENTVNSPCLLDRIHLSLEHIEIYIGKRYNIEGKNHNASMFIFISNIYYVVFFL